MPYSLETELRDWVSEPVPGLMSSILFIPVLPAQFLSRNALSTPGWLSEVSFYFFPPFSIEQKELTRAVSIAFYSPIFETVQQKTASSYLAVLWQEDPFKAKWSIAARAYSGIRDRIGKPSAPLDLFLELVCPELGIIDTANYMQKMMWVLEADANGALKVRQPVVPDVDSFEVHIKHTLMTERNVVHFCAEKGYISLANAIAIAGPQQAAAAAAPVDQQGLLAADPVAQQGLLAGGPVLADATSQFLFKAVSDPRSAASEIFGFDVDQLLGPAQQSELSNLPAEAEAEAQAEAQAETQAETPYMWTGCQADLYNPAEGTFDFESLGNNYGTPIFDTGNIADAQSFETMFGEVIQDGFS